MCQPGMLTQVEKREGRERPFILFIPPFQPRDPLRVHHTAPLTHENENDAGNGRDDRDDPVPHNHLLAGPADSQEVKVERGNLKESPPKRLIENVYLNNDGGGGGHQREGNDGQKENRIGQESDYRKHHSERNHARLTHIEARRRHIKPKEGEDTAADGAGEGGDIDLIVHESDKRIGGKDNRQHSAGQTVDTVYDGSREGGKHDDDKEGYEEDAQLKIAAERNTDRTEIDFVIEPETDDQGDGRDQSDFYFAVDKRVASESSAAGDLKRVFNQAHESGEEKGAQRHQRLSAAEEVELLRDLRREEHGQEINHTDGKEHRHPDDDPAETRGAHLLRGIMNAVESFGSARLCPGRLLPHFVPIQIPGEKRRDGNADKEGQNCGENDFEDVHLT